MKALFAPTVIKASAGTGKTFELSNRFIGLIAAGENPERILATTFTRKAAGEIAQRVFERTARAALSEKTACEMREFIGQPRFDSEAAVNLIEKLTSCQHRLHILTLDSFFNQVASSFALELGLDPGWRVSDEALDRRIMERTINKYCQDSDPERLAEQIRIINRQQVKTSVYDQLLRRVTCLYDVYRQSGEAAWKWLKIESRQLERSSLKSAVDKLKTVKLPETNKGKPDANWEKAVFRICNLALHDQWRDFVKENLVQKVIKGEEKYNRRKIPDSVASTISVLARHAGAVMLSEIGRQTAETYEVLRILDQIYIRERLISKTLGFSDIKYLLVSASVCENPADIFYRLDTKLSHLLLDEFQDTSWLEWKVLEPLASEVVSQKDRVFFCVGDSKQAIYGWRGGVVEIFDSLAKKWPQLEVKTKEASYRCSKSVLDFVNTVFGSLESNCALLKYPEAARQWSKRFISHETVRKDLCGYVCYAGQTGGEEDKTSFMRAAKLVKDLMAKRPELDIGVLVRRNRYVSEMMFELGRDGIEIAASEEGGNPLTDSPAVNIVLSLIKLIDHPGDSIAAYHVANSPLGEGLGLKDYRDKGQIHCVTAGERGKIAASGLGRAAAGWSRYFSGRASERDLRRMEQLVELAFVFEEQLKSRLTEFIEFVKKKKVEDPTAAGVRVMTVHQAKGLEFDAVILPEINDHLTVRSDLVETFRSNPVGMIDQVCLGTSKEVRALDSNLEKIHDCHKQRKIEEALSVMYVAFTRARHALYLIGTADPKDPLKLSLEGIVRAAFFARGERSSLIEIGDSGWLEKFPEGQAGKACDIKAKAKKPIRFKKDSSGVIYHKAPSQLEGGESFDAEYRMQVTGSSALRRGKVLHRFFEQIEWIDDGKPSLKVLKELCRGRSDGDELIDHFMSLLEGSPARDLFSRSYYREIDCDSLQVFRERRFAIRDGERLLSGAFDRLVICRREDLPVFAHIVDFKSDQILAESDLSRRIEYYRPQLEAYRAAASGIFGLESVDIKTSLMFIAAGRVVEL